jgi:hypothetical protein
MEIETRLEIQRMCAIILGSQSISKELDSLTLRVGHHPNILNAENENYRLVNIEGNNGNTIASLYVLV